MLSLIPSRANQTLPPIELYERKLNAAKDKNQTIKLDEKKTKRDYERESEIQQEKLNDPRSIWHAAAFKDPDQLVLAAFWEINQARKLKAEELKLEEAKLKAKDPKLKAKESKDKVDEWKPLSFHEAEALIPEVIENARGAAYHETLLHMACLFSNIEMAIYLVETYPILIDKAYEGVYAGETALHIAVVHGDVQLVKILLNHEEVIGDFEEPGSKADNVVETLVEMVSPDNGETKTIKRVHHKNGREDVFSEHKLVDTVLKPTGTTTTTRMEREFLTLKETKPSITPKPKGRTAANPNCAVTGKFFSKSSIESVYFGDHPLAFAVCLKRPEKKEIIRLLIKHGAVIAMQDRYGNSLLHLCVYHEDVEMYNYICDLFNLYHTKTLKMLNDEISNLNTELKRDANYDSNNSFKYISEKDYNLENLKNDKGRTALNYALELGKEEMVKTILARKKKVLWTYGPMAHVAYPLDEIDTFGHSSRDMNSGLTMLVYSSKFQSRHKAILENAPFKEIAHQKWHTFAKYIFSFIVAHYFLHLLAIVLVVVRPESLLVNSEPGQFLHACEIFVLINSAFFIIAEFQDLAQLRLRYCFREGSWIPLFPMVSLSSSLLFFAAIPLRLLNFAHQEDMVVSTAGLLAFMYVLYYARGNKLIGHYVVVLRKVVLKDLFQFGIIYIIFMLGFALCFVAVFRDKNSEVFLNYPWAMLTLFKMSLFAFDDIDIQGSHNTGFAVTLLVAFTILTGVLMLNLLVATMNASYSTIKAESELQWHLERSSIVLSIERRIPNWVANSFKSLTMGQSGEELGINEKRHFLVISESTVGMSPKSSKRLRNLFRSAIIRVCLVFCKRAQGKARDLIIPERTRIYEKKTWDPSELRIDLLSRRMRVYTTLVKNSEARGSNEEAENLVKAYEAAPTKDIPPEILQSLHERRKTLVVVEQEQQPAVSKLAVDVVQSLYERGVLRRKPSGALEDEQKPSVEAEEKEKESKTTLERKRTSKSTKETLERKKLGKRATNDPIVEEE